MAFFTEDYENSTPTQRVVAGGACIVLGAIILLLAICGSFFDYASLVKMGFGGWTIPCYFVVMVCGVFIFARARYALVVALCAEFLEIILYFATQMTTSPDVGFLILLKIIVIGCCIYLASSVVTFNDPDDEPIQQPQQFRGPRPNARGQFPPQPQQRPMVPQRSRNYVQRRQPPQPKQ